MKKSLALTLALVSATAVAHAQDAGGFRIGIKGGATYANLAGKDVQQITGPTYDTDLSDRLLGFNAGLAFTIPLSSDGFFSFAPEVLVNRKGYQIEQKFKNPTGAISSLEIETKRKLTYIDVPLLAKINAGGLFFELGPQVGYLARSSQDTETTTKFSDGRKDEAVSGESDGKSDLASFDIGAIAGLGYQTEGGLSVGLRYNRGFNSLIDTKNIDGEPKAFNDAFMLQVGYLLPLGK
ncbi:porin family protein [Hymenobacter sp. APR13]|jgi:Outer membrane protein beta-barrel domain|uniref:porin family protein n=1 Tax=Hymenobacter sp. APR13 TaxID=1356852 RepID=UPI0004E09441|nr:porin family protein [Hymenobacter sp. APR13]AII52462.1 hypothetical protein N008_10800 [Hymenobacter sp. APR13]